LSTEVRKGQGLDRGVYPFTSALMSGTGIFVVF